MRLWKGVIRDESFAGRVYLLNEVITTILSNWIDLILLFHLFNEHSSPDDLDWSLTKPSYHQSLISSSLALTISARQLHGGNQSSLGVYWSAPRCDQHVFCFLISQNHRVYEIKRLTTWGALPPSHHNSSLIVAFALVLPSGKGNIRGGACRVVRKWLGWEREWSWGISFVLYVNTSWYQGWVAGISDEA